MPRRRPQTTTTTNSFQLEAAPDADLVVGYVTIAAACTPYVLGVIFPDFFEDKFFLPIYKNNEEGRAAEIGWKVRYAALGLALTTLIASEVIFFQERRAADILRDSYVAWALFYTEATRKIRSEAKSGVLKDPEDRAGIQLWHSFVVLVLWADVSETATGNAITKFLIELFT